MFYVKVILAALAGVLVWSAVVIAGALLGWWRSPIAPPDDPDAFFTAARTLIEERNAGDVALVLIEDGEVYGEHYSANGDAVDRDTLFQTASMSKWITAWGVMTLVEAGELDLDRPVSAYLSRWQLPASELGNEGVTARRLLSHTAGLTDGLGFGDYAPDETVPLLEASLTDPRASSGEAVEIAVGHPPGQWQYSGGGYLLLQLLVEEVTGESFEDYMDRAVLEPLGMARSTFRHVGSLTNVSPAYDEAGEPAPLYRYASSAATGFATTAADLARFLQAQLPGGVEPRPLQPATIEAMREPHGWLMGAAVWGLGTMLYVPTQTGDYVFGHDGQNDPAINASARVNPDTGDGVAVLASGSPDLATTIAFHWTFWQAGAPDFLAISGELRRVLPALLIGNLVALVLVVGGALRLRRRRSRDPVPAGVQR